MIDPIMHTLMQLYVIFAQSAIFAYSIIFGIVSMLWGHGVYSVALILGTVGLQQMKAHHP